MILVLLPFWTSLLVRTTAWMVLLQSKGVVNDACSGSASSTSRCALIYNRVGVVHGDDARPAAVHDAAALQRDEGDLARPTCAPRARSARRRSTAFLRVYLPQTMPGVGAGCLLVFILALGYYITPALVGGAADQMISYFIALYTDRRPQLGPGLGARARCCCSPPLVLLRGVSTATLVHRQQVTAGLKPLSGNLPPYAEPAATRLAMRSMCRLRARVRLPDRADPGDRAAVLQLAALLHLSAAGPVAALVRRFLRSPPLA